MQVRAHEPLRKSQDRRPSHRAQVVQAVSAFCRSVQTTTSYGGCLTHSFTGSGFSLPAGLSSQVLAHAGPAPSRRGAGTTGSPSYVDGLLCLGLAAYWSWNQSVPLRLTSSTVLLDTTSGSPAGVVRLQGPEGQEFRGGPSVSEVLVLPE
jgi:hypothetical protein